MRWDNLKISFIPWIFLLTPVTAADRKSLSYLQTSIVFPAWISESLLQCGGDVGCHLLDLIIVRKKSLPWLNSFFMFYENILSMQLWMRTCISESFINVSLPTPPRITALLPAEALVACRVCSFYCGIHFWMHTYLPVCKKGKWFLLLLILIFLVAYLLTNAWCFSQSNLSKRETIPFPWFTHWLN